MLTLTLVTALSLTTHQSYIESGEFYASRDSEAETADAYPCAYFGSAVAPLGTDSRLCGLSWQNGDLTVQHRGSDAFIGSELTIRASQHAYDRGEFWVMRKNNTALAGIRRDGTQNAVMISLDEGEWRSSRINCGENGFYHAFPLTNANRYTVVAYSSTGSYLFCRLDFVTHEQTQTWVELPEVSGPLNELRIEWGEGADYQIRSRNGDLLYTSNGAD